MGVSSSYGGLRPLHSDSAVYVNLNLLVVTVMQVGSSMQKPLDAALL